MGKGLLLAAVIGVLATWAGPQTVKVAGASGRAGPVILSVEWESAPVVGEPAYLIVDSVDPHGIISEVQVMFGNTIVFAHAFCLGEVGRPHRMVLENIYEEPGEYTVVVRAISRPNCKARGGSRESEEVHLETIVEP